MRRKKEIEIQNMAYEAAKTFTNRLRDELLLGIVPYSWVTWTLPNVNPPKIPNIHNNTARIMDLEVKLNLLLEHLGLEVVNMEAKTILKKK